MSTISPTLQFISYGNAFENLKAEAHQDWQAYTRHEFVKNLQDGSLSESAFVGYMKQDYVFLIHFSRAWALAVVKSETIDEMTLASKTLDALVNYEIQLHVKTCALLGVSEQDLFATEEHSANLAYTRYVLDAGLQGDFLDLIVALTPCVLGYGEIGYNLKCDRLDSNPYQDWIKTYGGAEYQNACLTVGNLLESSLTYRLGPNYAKSPRWANLQKRFTVATRLEVGFWDMGLSFGDC